MMTTGNQLKERREELGYSLKQMSEKTKVPLAKLEALELENFDYFKDDFSYIKFYVRYYCQALHLDYEQLREGLEKSLDDFSHTEEITKIENMQLMSERISERAGNKSKVKPKRKLDFSFLTFFISVVLLVVSLILVFIFWVMPHFNRPEGPATPVIEIPQPPVINEPEDETPIYEDKELAVEQISATEYEVTGFNEEQELNLKLMLKSNAYISILVDGRAPNNFVNNVRHELGTVIDFKYNVTAGQEVSINIGWMNGNTLMLDELEVPLDEEVARRSGSVTLIFRHTGDQAGEGVE